MLSNDRIQALRAKYQLGTPNASTPDSKIARLQVEADAAKKEAERANSPAHLALETVKNVGKTILSPIIGTGESLGESAAAGDVAKNVSEGEQGVQDTALRVLKQIKANREAGKDTARLEQAYNSIAGHTQETDLKNILPTLNKSNLDVVLEAVGTVLSGVGFGAGTKGTTTAVRTATGAVADAAKTTATKARPVTEALVSRSKEIIKPSPSPLKATGEVLQGKAKDVKHGLQALSQVDTTGITTFKQLESKLTETIGNLSKKVDEHLDLDPTPMSLEQLATKSVTETGREIKRNFVDDALKHLKELYSTTADDVGLAQVEDVIDAAKTQGLTRNEVNGISRLYNQEFGAKAFNKLGDPLTSVNAQMYENIRTGLKATARQGMGGSEAEATDKIISSLYNTRQLVTKNVEAVNKLRQRIAERGLLEKVGHAVSKYADVFTGGSIRGLVGGLLPRGAGYKVLNALDLEDRLAKNLDIIQKAIQSGSDEEIIKLIKQLTTSTL